MYAKNWQVIKDDVKKTFEVCGQERNTNAFTNQVYAMQRAGMNVSCTIPPVTNHASSKDMVKITGYQKEAGLYDRLTKEFQERTRPNLDDIDFEE